MSFENATPRPWATNSHHVPARVESEAEHGIVNDGWIICDCDGPDGEANAELIVRAVNAFEPLTEALEDARKAISNAIEVVGSRKGDPEFATLAKVEAALAKARGEQ